MAQYAEVSDDNIVINVWFVEDNIITDGNGNEVEELGSQHLRNCINENGRFIRTSQSGAYRGKFAGFRDNYDEAADVFYSERPYPSWTLDSNFGWNPPVEHPAGDIPYAWNEDTKEWFSLEPEPPEESSSEE